jgi:hypothetical protein
MDIHLFPLGIGQGSIYIIDQSGVDQVFYHRLSSCKVATSSWLRSALIRWWARRTRDWAVRKEQSNMSPIS